MALATVNGTWLQLLRRDRNGPRRILHARLNRHTGLDLRRWCDHAGGRRLHVGHLIVRLGVLAVVGSVGTAIAARGALATGQSQRRETRPQNEMGDYIFHE